MRTRLQKALNANVHPLLCALPCILLMAGLGQAAFLTKQISDTEDNIQAMYSHPYPHELWLNPHRSELLWPISDLQNTYGAK